MEAQSIQKKKRNLILNFEFHYFEKKKKKIKLGHDNCELQNQDLEPKQRDPSVGPSLFPERHLCMLLHHPHYDELTKKKKIMNNEL